MITIAYAGSLNITRCCNFATTDCYITAGSSTAAAYAGCITTTRCCNNTASDNYITAAYFTKLGVIVTITTAYAGAITTAFSIKGAIALNH